MSSIQPSFLVGKVVALQLQRLLDEVNYLDPFSQNSGMGMEQKQCCLHFRWSLVRMGWSLLDLSMAFDIIDHDNLLGHLQGLGISSILLCWFESFF